jgi:hypothetical protein
MCWLSRNSGASTSWNPKSLSRPVVGKLYLFTGRWYAKFQMPYAAAHVSGNWSIFLCQQCFICMATDEYTATMFRRESNSRRAGSLRVLCDQWADENSQSTKYSLTYQSELLLILREKKMAAVDICLWTGENELRKFSIVQQSIRHGSFSGSKSSADVYVALASFCVPYRALRQGLWRKPINALAII